MDDLDSLRLALAAEEHNHRADNEYLVGERDDLRATGDLMQSSLSRLAEFLRAEYPVHRWDSLPYEVRMALIEGEGAVASWTEIRRKASAFHRTDQEQA